MRNMATDTSDWCLMQKSALNLGAKVRSGFGEWWDTHRPVSHHAVLLLSSIWGASTDVGPWQGECKVPVVLKGIVVDNESPNFAESCYPVKIYVFYGAGKWLASAPQTWDGGLPEQRTGMKLNSESNHWFKRGSPLDQSPKPNRKAAILI